MRIFIIAVLLFLAINSFSQKVEIGIKAGVNFANQVINTSIVPARDFVVGFHGGVYASKMFTKHSGIQIEVLYSEQGHHEMFDALDFTYKFNYINLPILYKYKLNERISFMGGYQFGILTKATTTVKNYLSGSGSTDINSTDQYHAFDHGVVLGATVEVIKNINFSLRYTYGITNYVKNDSDYSSVNTNIQLSVGYQLPLFK